MQQWLTTCHDLTGIIFSAQVYTIFVLSGNEVSTEIQVLKSFAESFSQVNDKTELTDF